MMKVAIVGAGSMGRHHARLVQANPDMELMALVDPRGDFYGSAPGVPVLPSVAALGSIDVDLVIVASPSGTHADLAFEAASFGCAVLVEKPLALSGLAATSLANDAEGLGIAIGVGHTERHNPAMIEARDLLRTKEVLSVVTLRTGPMPDRKPSANVIFDLAVHDIDAASYLTGVPYGGVVAAFGGEDEATICGMLSNEIPVTHVVSRVSQRKRRRTIVNIRGGSIVIDTAAPALTWHGVTGRGRYALPSHEPLAEEHAQMANLMKGHSSSICTVREGAQVVAIAEQATKRLEG